MNAVAYFHAYKFTHFSEAAVEKTKSPEKLSSLDKIKTLLTGVNNPRPNNKTDTGKTVEVVTLQSNKRIECWYMKSHYNRDSAKGTVSIFHGYSGEKSSMMDKAEEFQKLGYNTILVDFMGSGGSEGNQTTLGYKEAEQVKTVYDYLKTKGEQNIYLFGTSMGAVAILKSISDHDLTPKSIIIECPFGSMYQTTCARFRIMNAPVFPMAGLLVFWGGVQNGFWAFGHNPVKYSLKVNCPTLLLYGEKDRNVSREEIDAIFKNIKGKKELKTYQLAGHENYLLKYQEEWVADVSRFLQQAN
ncbi:alpha/beta hydrolase [Lacibacter sp. H407]|uniref:alpha/beta hydrolase n=1 Tax=Lacibacter sp. H407 TaxID=3133423 RepID=UPI0030C60FD7